MLVQVSNNRVHFIITRGQPVSMIWVTLDFFFFFYLRCYMEGFHFCRLWTTLNMKFFSFLGEMTYEPADKSQLIGQSPNPCYSTWICLENWLPCMNYRYGVILRENVCVRICLCIWTCLEREANHKCPLHNSFFYLGKVNINSSLKWEEGHRRWRALCNREWGQWQD